MLDIQSRLQSLSDSGLADRASAFGEPSRPLPLSTRLYGRDHQVARLQSILVQLPATPEHASAQTPFPMVMVAGAAGLGKSKLVHDSYHTLPPEHLHFAAGKYEQFRRNVPYSAIAQVCHALIYDVLSKPQADLSTLRSALLAKLEGLGQVLIEVIPLLEQLVGPQPAVVPLPPSAAQHRFTLVLQHLIQVFAEFYRSLVIFLDDLQWADGASLQVLQRFQVQCPNLLLIGAYRDDEVLLGHPLHRTLKQLQQAHRLETIVLHPLTLTDVRQLLAELLSCADAETRSLAELVQRKTGGNPFFIQEFLKSLQTERLLRFNWQANSWEWDAEQIASQTLPDSVIDLMAHKLATYPENEQRVLQRAACLGHHFDLYTLALLEQQSLEALAAQLQRAIHDGLVRPLGPAQAESGSPSEAPDRDYQFRHDRIAQAAYGLIAASDRAALHWQVGQLLRQQSQQAETTPDLFTILNHLNVGETLIQSAPERLELAQLNLVAGQQAQAMVAHEPAYEYFQAGIRWLGPDPWTAHYTLSLALYRGAVETAYLTANFSTMARLAEVVEQQGQTLLDLISVYEIKILAHQAQNQLLEALQLARSVLAQLGVQLPERPHTLQISWWLMRTQLILFGRNPEDLARLPPMADRQQQAVMRILSLASSVAYLAAPRLLPLMICKQIQLSVDYGHTPESTYAYAAYGLMLCGMQANFEAGYRFGQLSLQLAQQGANQRYQARVRLIFEGFIRPWHEDISYTLAPLQTTYQLALASGDLEYAGYAAHMYCLHAYVVGQPLLALEEQMAAYNAAIATLGQTTAFHQNTLYHQTVWCLLDRVDDPSQLQGEFYNLAQMQSVHAAANDQAALHGAHLNQGVLSYLFYNYAHAEQHLTLAEHHVSGAMASFVSTLLYFYAALASLAIYGQKSPREQRRIQRRVQRYQQQLQAWAQQTPSNFLGKYYLVEAERYRVLAQPWQAVQNYEQAIHWALTNGWPNEVALTYELTAKFYLAEGQTLNAQGYLLEARKAYQHWGATAKVNHLERTYAPVFATQSVRLQAEQPQGPTSEVASCDRPPAMLDFATVFHASQALAHEIVPERLLHKLMKIVLDNAGAEKGILLLKQGQQWVIEAEAIQDQSPVATLKSVPMEALDSTQGIPLLATSIVNYTVRTQTDVVLANATQSPQFSFDPYIQAVRPKSLLCSPLQHQGQLVGVVYLENNQVAGAFTPERLEVLHLLSGQAAISLTNAQLYEQLESLLQDLRHEIHVRTHVEQALRDSEQRLAQFLEAVPVGVLVVDAQGYPYYANQTASEILGDAITPDQSLETLLSQRPAYVAGTNQPYPWEQRGLVQALQGHTVTIDNLEIRHGPTVTPLEILAKPIPDEQGKVAYAIAVLQDITQRKQVEQERLQFVKTTAILQQNNVKLERLASYDALTQVANRRRFDEYLDLEWQRLQGETLPLALIMCDVDHFKRFNDHYGHQAGDVCLQKVAQALTRAVKRPADLVARYGGEEFAVVLPTSDTHGAQTVAQQIQAEVWALQIPHAHSQVHAHVTLSLGIAAIIPSSQQSAANLIMAADLALYEAKKLGRNRVYSF